MSVEQESFINQTDRAVIEQIAAANEDLNGRRAAAMVAIADGRSQAEAAQETGLTEGQVSYIVRKYREQGLNAFPNDLIGDDGAISTGDETEQLRTMVDDLNQRIAELQTLVDEKGLEDNSGSSPLPLLVMIRDNISKLTPDMQVDVLRNFQGMSAEDLLDINTWKGMAYMMTYSARFQAGQVRDKVAGTINHVVPEPVQPGRLWQLGKRGLDRLTPDIAKQILSTFEGASREDLLDLDTWKGLAYMINYSLQFQVEQLKNRLSGQEDSEV
jgi:transposase